MTSLLTIAACSTALLGIWLFRRELLTIGRGIAGDVLAFRARLHEVDDELWRR